MDTNKTKVLAETMKRLSPARDMNVVMEIVREAAQAHRADVATFILKEDQFCYYAHENAISPLWKGNRFPMELCVSGRAMLRRL